ncbi:MAG TPA: hypothetical protein EYN54_12080 [Methylococcaceae bacterium]|nr:hypothetical protein [Methylococcaceae bacterium]
MGFFKRMTKKKIEVLTWLKEGFEEECGLAPYSADSISHVVNDCTTDSLTRAMRKTLNTLVDEGLLYKVKLKAEVTINYEGGSVTIDKKMWHYDLIEKLSSADKVEADRLAITDSIQADLELQAAEYGLSVMDYQVADTFDNLPPKLINELSDIDIDNELVNELSECDEPVNDIDDEESIWIEVMIDHANNVPTEEESVLLNIMAEEAGH